MLHVFFCRYLLCTDRWMSPQVPAPESLWPVLQSPSTSETRRDRMCCSSLTTFSASHRLDQRYTEVLSPHLPLVCINLYLVCMQNLKEGCNLVITSCLKCTCASEFIKTVNRFSCRWCVQTNTTWFSTEIWNFVHLLEIWEKYYHICSELAI